MVELKRKIFEEIENIEDIEFLKEIALLIKLNSGLVKVQFTPDQHQEIQLSIDEVEKGDFLENDQLMELLKKR